MDERDRELEQLFDRMRAADARRAPSFEGVMGPRRQRVTVSRPGLVMALAAVVLAAIAVWQYAAPNETKLQIEFTAGDMYVPTDYLLDMMNFPRAGEVPRIGAADWYPLPLSGDASLDTRRTP